MVTVMALSYRKPKYQSVFSAVSSPCTEYEVEGLEEYCIQVKDL